MRNVLYMLNLCANARSEIQVRHQNQIRNFALCSIDHPARYLCFKLSKIRPYKANKVRKLFKYSHFQGLSDAKGDCRDLAIISAIASEIELRETYVVVIKHSVMIAWGFNYVCDKSWEHILPSQLREKSCSVQWTFFI